VEILRRHRAIKAQLERKKATKSKRRQVQKINKNTMPD
jgi:hypothetical protein